MSKVKQTKLTIQEDRATAMSSMIKGANINALAFNLEYIAERDSHFALELMGLYEKAKELENA